MAKKNKNRENSDNKEKDIAPIIERNTDVTFIEERTEAVTENKKEEKKESSEYPSNVLVKKEGMVGIRNVTQGKVQITLKVNSKFETISLVSGQVHYMSSFEGLTAQLNPYVVQNLIKIN